MTIANRLTPSTPLELSFGSQPVSAGTKVTTLIGHLAATGSTVDPYTTHEVVNFGDPDAAKAEVDALAGAGSMAGKMAYAFVKSNSAVNRGSFPAFRMLFLADDDTDFGTADAAFAPLKLLRSDCIVSPYDSSSAALVTKLDALAALLSGPDRDLMGQFGTTIVAATLEDDTTVLAFTFDSQYLVLPWLRDTAVAPSQSAAEIAAAFAAVMLVTPLPYVPLTTEELGGILPPVTKSDFIEVSPTGLSEAALVVGVSPLYCTPDGAVRILRSRTSRLTIDGTTPATAYIDWQDFQVLYDFREVSYLRLQQPDFKKAKASLNTAALLKDEILRLAAGFEDLQAFQKVKELASQFVVAPSSGTRGRFDFMIPVNVVPGLYVIAGNIQATTQFDTFTL
jgi:phage tail sheath gpL-like